MLFVLTGILSVIIGVVIALAGNFSFAQELMPEGMISIFLVSLWHGRLGFAF
jgi:hypothetical protein